MKTDMDVTFSDVHIESQYTEVESRKTDVDITSDMGKFKLKLPVVSSNMPQITEWKMAAEMAFNGGIGVIHRFKDIEWNVDQYNKALKAICVKSGIASPELESKVAVSIGIKEEEKKRFEALRDAGANIFCIDVAHGHSAMMKKMIQWLRVNAGQSISIIAGNVANAEGALDLAEWGADIIKVGIGPGCFTKGTKVKTDKGYKNIENITVGDLVLTHRGRYREVLDAITKKERKFLIEINKNITCTGNHEFYVLHKKYRTLATDENIKEYAEWVSAEDLTQDYLLLEVLEEK